MKPNILINYTTNVFLTYILIDSIKCIGIKKKRKGLASLGNKFKDQKR